MASKKPPKPPTEGVAEGVALRLDPVPTRYDKGIPSSVVVAPAEKAAAKKTSAPRKRATKKTTAKKAVAPSGQTAAPEKEQS